MKQSHCLICFQDVETNLSLDQWLRQDALICGDCQRKFEYINLHTHLEGMPLHILYNYNDFLENLLYQFKENRDIALHDVFFHAHIKEINDKYRHSQVIIMPSAYEKIRERGFHHMQEMLKECHLPIKDVMEKTQNHKQSLQSFEERQNIASYIRLKRNYQLSKQPILLIDDVITTSATLKHAYHLLHSHTSKIEALVLCANPRFVESCDEK